MLAAALVSWVLVGRVLRPLHEVTATARRLSAESLDTRIGLTGARGEVAELAAGFDAMLDRLQAAFDAQRRFVANASHELRTPLAVLRTEVDVTLADPDADVAELRRMGEVVREATRRADDLVAGLLLLARTEAADAVPARARRPRRDRRARARRGARRGPRPRACRCGTDLAPAPTARRRRRCSSASPGNLVENAVRHNVDGGWVTSAHRRSRTGTRCSRVASSGPWSRRRPVAELFEPFRRGVGRTGTRHRAGPLDRARRGARARGTRVRRAGRGRRARGDRGVAAGFPTEQLITVLQ